ncbi:hypothetical protein N9W79_02020 [bacterium]|nr:hypothetical protein [bacterium]
MKTFFKTLTLFISLASSVAAADAPATHGMLLFGQNQTYASHLPMYHKPHDYQLIMKLKLKDIKPPMPRGNPSTLDNYSIAKQYHKLFTLVPEQMDLTKIIDGTKKSFRAKIFQGHFERGGHDLGLVTVIIEKVIYSQKLDPNAKPSSEFLAFGEKGEYYGAHIVGGKPNYDSVFSILKPKPGCSPRAGNCGGLLKKVSVPDSALPIIIRDYGFSDQAPEAGDLIGPTFSTSTNVIEVIYSEYNELSH